MPPRRRFSVLLVAWGIALIPFGLLAPAARAFAASDAGVPRYERTPCPPKLPALAHSRCGFLVVPENRTKPHSRLIGIAVAVVPSRLRAAAADPLVYLDGGPGGVPFLEAPAILGAGFNRDRDLILVQQRGTLYSLPALTCRNIDRFNVRVLGLRYDSDAARALHVAATRECRHALVAAGADLSAYNTTENAADFADLRRVLGYRSWNVYGVSYGTDLAQVYLRNHPAGVRSLILDSTVPTRFASFADFWPNAGAGLENVSSACAAQPACRQSFPDVKATFTHLVSSLERQPVSVDVTNIEFKTPTRVVLDGGALVNWLVSMSFFTPQFVDVPAWIAQLAAGHPQRIAASRALPTPPGLVGYGLTYGVFCREWAAFDSQQAVNAAGRRAFPTHPAPVLRQPPQAPFVFDDCGVWNVPAAPAAFRTPLRSRVPTLIVSGTFDGVTTLRWARAVAEHLPNARIVGIAGAGHFVLPESRCAQAIMTSFLAFPAAPDTGCSATLKPGAFKR